ncbi:MAG: glycosyltransferase family 39 protein [Candidatus Altiarchaeota archaeon]
MRVRNLNILLLLSILAYLLFRLPDLGVMPYWDWDEGVNMNMAYNVAYGRPLWFTLIFPFVPHPPLYLLSLGLMLRLFGNELIVLRIFSVLLGLFTLSFVYLTGRELKGPSFGVLASALYALYPMAIYWDRMGFANNMFSLLIVASLYSILRYLRTGQTRFLYCSALLAGLSPVTQYIGASTVLSFAIALYLAKRIRLKPILFSLLPFFALVSAMLILMRAPFIEDVRFQIDRFNLAGFLMLVAAVLLAYVGLHLLKPLKRIISDAFWNAYARLGLSREFLAEYDVPILLISVNFVMALDAFHVLSYQYLFTGLGYYWVGIVGLFLFERGIPRAVLLSYFIPLFLLIFKIGRTDHMTIPLNPFFAIGFAALLMRLTSVIRQLTSNRKVIAGFTVLLVLPFASIFLRDVQAFVLTGLKTESLTERFELASYLDNNTAPGEYVLVDSHEGRFIKANYSIVTQSIAVNGRQIGYYRGDYEPGRFVVNFSYQGAKYIVLEEGGIEWLSGNVSDIASEISEWGVEAEFGRFQVLRNPK